MLDALCLVEVQDAGEREMKGGEAVSMGCFRFHVGGVCVWLRGGAVNKTGKRKETRGSKRCEKELSCVFARCGMMCRCAYLIPHRFIYRRTYRKAAKVLRRVRNPVCVFVLRSMCFVIAGLGAVLMQR